MKKPWVVFDNDVHKLDELLKLPENWEEYCDIKIEYSANFSSDYVVYEGNDLIGAGAYKFTIEFKAGINTNPTNPSVVWDDGSADDDTEAPGTPESVTFILNATKKPAAEEVVEEEEVVDYLDPEAVQYAEGEEDLPSETPDDGDEEEPEAPEAPKVPGGDAIAAPAPEYSEDDKWLDAIQQITMNVDKLRVTATGWSGADAAARLVLDYSRYENAAQVQEIIEAVLKYKYYDTLGKEVTTSDMKAGCTYFVHPELDDKYKDYIEIEYADGVKKNYDFSLNFRDDDNRPWQDITLPEGVIAGTKYLVKLEAKEYTGEELTFVLDFVAQHMGILFIVESESDSLTQINAGKYYVTVCFRDDVKAFWGGTNYDRTAIIFEFEITKKEITLGQTNLDDIKYTGKEIDISTILKELDFGEYVIIEYGSEDKRTDVGTYSITIRLNPEYGDNIGWASGTQLNPDGLTVTLEWKITQATIDGTWNDLGRLTLTSESYVGGTEGKIEYIYTDKETGAVVAANALVTGRTYTVKAVLLDTVNLKWADGFEDTYEFTLTVELVWLPKPELSKVTMGYTGQEIRFEIIDESKYTGHIEVVEGSLTQTELGSYTVVIRLVSDNAVWETGSTDDVTLTFEITQAVITGTWIEGAGIMDLESTYRGSYDGIVEYVYTDVNGNVVNRVDLVKGETYTVTVTLKDTEHFRWADGTQLTQTFEFTAEIVIIPKLTLKESEVYYTGEAITVEIVDYAKYAEHLELVAGSKLSYTEAGTYEIRLKLKGAAEWEAGMSGELVLTFTIKKVVLRGEWTDEGRIEFEANSYKGDYSEVVEYIYRDVNGNEVSASELKEGERYTATIRLKSGKGANFDDSELEKTYEFTYRSVKKGISWWVILLIVIAIILLILIIIVIIYTERKRKRLREEALLEEQYEASGAYGDEYDSDYDYGTGTGETTGETGYDSYDGGADTSYDYGTTDGTTDDTANY